MSKWTKSLVVYFFFSYLFSWVVFILLALNHHGTIHLFSDDEDHARIADLWHAFGALGPALGALITLRLFYKNHRILKYYTAKEVTITGWVLAFSPFLYLVIAIMIVAVITGHWFSISGFFRDNNLLTPFNLFAWLMPSFTYGLFEEIGWRGFAIPALQTKYSAMIASTILTVFWVGWHIPSLFYRYQLNVPMFIGFAMGIYAGAIYLTYIFNYSKGSLLVVSIWHITWDLVSMIGKEGMLAAIMSTIIMVLAIFVVIRYKGKNLSPFDKIILQGS